MTIRILVGDCRDVLRTLPDESVHCCITSPPYWGLRDYGVAGQLGLEPTPEEYVTNLVAVFREVWRVLRNDGTLWLVIGDSYAGSNAQQGGDGSSSRLGPVATDTQWTRDQQAMRTAGQGITKTGIGLKPKDLVGIPWRVAFALQADGWYLRSDIIWAKLNPMPESVTDRPTKSHEYIFLLAKAERYYWDQEAVREEHKLESRLRATRGWNGNMQRDYVHGQQSHMADYHGKTVEEAMALPGRTIRTSDWWNNSLDAVIKQQEAWLAHLKAVRDDGGMLMDADGDPLALMVNTSPLSLPHYAAFPTALVEPMIKAGTSQYGCCSAMKTKLKLREEVQVQCGKPWTRVMEREGKPSGRSDDTVYTGRAYTSPQSQVWGSKRNLGGDGTGATTTGWRPGCTCNADIRSAVVLDPFSGAGTTLLVANRLGRDGIGIELNPDYARMSEKRIAEDAGPMFDMVTVETPEQLEIPLCQNHILNE